jgi:hypothetical protein
MKKEELGVPLFSKDKNFDNDPTPDTFHFS